jgi:hypothetical protein
MLSEQGQLPRLPVNTVEDAIQDYLRAAEALLSEEDFAQTKLQAQLFLETDGPALQKMLVEYEAEEGRNSYLEVGLALCVCCSPYFCKKTRYADTRSRI